MSGQRTAASVKRFRVLVLRCRGMLAEWLSAPSRGQAGRLVGLGHSLQRKNMMKLSKSNLAIAAAVSAVVATTALASAFPGQQYASQASITITQARSMAQRVVPGKILSEELEKEAGGTGLRYTFDIRKANGGVHEVGIDAKSGRVLEDSVTRHPQRRPKAPKVRATRLGTLACSSGAAVPSRRSLLRHRRVFKTARNTVTTLGVVDSKAGGDGRTFRF
jgi:uncharacterized membrane protein YkoI